MDNVYIEKPKEIKAIQYSGYKSLSSVEEFMGDYFDSVLFRPFSESLIISKGDREVKVGDYIVKDIKKLFYSLPQDHFEALYDKVD